MPSDHRHSMTMVSSDETKEEWVCTLDDCTFTSTKYKVGRALDRRFTGCGRPG